MRALILSLAACAALGGCAYYGDPYYGGGYGYGYGYPSTSIGIYQSDPGYYHDGHGRHRGPYRGGDNARYRDRDGDGVPNRFDRDRDNDGVPNGRDSRPNNPWRR